MKSILTVILLTHYIAHMAHAPSAKDIKDSATHLLQFSQHNPCIAQAVGSLHNSCQKISFEEKSLMALRLTNCLLEKAQKQKIECSDGEDTESCTSRLHGDSWTSYTNFYTHIDNLCFYYHSLVWEEKTSKLIDGLGVAAEKTRNTLNENLQQTNKILTQQSSLRQELHKSAQLQRLLHESISKSSAIFEGMSSNMTSQLSSIQSNIIEHYSSIQSVFKTVDGALTKISSMQSFILNEVMYSHSCIFYYLCCIAVILLVSLSPSYSSARLNTLGLIVFNMLVEKFLTALNLDWYINVDRLRWIFLLLIGFSFFISYQRYQRQREEMFLSLVRATSRIENDMRPSRIKDMMWSVMKRRPEGVM